MWFDRHTPEEARERMVERQIARRGIEDPLVLEAMREVPRHRFVPSGQQEAAYADRALPIGHGATISQPYIVALMTVALRPGAGLRVLEVGTGSGYQAAVLAACGCEVFSVERVPALYEAARRALEETGYGERVRLRVADGSRGWEEEAPFERILVTAAHPEVPDPLRRQLADRGLLIAPIGSMLYQVIRRYRKHGDALEAEDLEGARFVPLVREEPEEPA